VITGEQPAAQVISDFPLPLPFPVNPVISIFVGCISGQNCPRSKRSKTCKGLQLGTLTEKGCDPHPRAPDGFMMLL
jgi:hypothetical protein